MGIAKQLLKSAARGVYTRVMDRVGGKVIAGFADTSSDAPDAYYEPKRDVYKEMVKEQAQKEGKPSE